MRLFKTIIKIALAFLVFGAAASLFISSTKEQYITFNDDENDLDLY